MEVAAAWGYLFSAVQSVNCSEQQLLQLGVFNPPNCQWSDPSTCFSGCSPVTINGVVVIQVLPGATPPVPLRLIPIEMAAVQIGSRPPDAHRRRALPTGPVDSDCGVNARLSGRVNTDAPTPATKATPKPNACPIPAATSPALIRCPVLMKLLHLLLYLMQLFAPGITRGCWETQIMLS